MKIDYPIDISAGLSSMHTAHEWFPPANTLTAFLSPGTLVKVATGSTVGHPSYP